MDTMDSKPCCNEVCIAQEPLGLVTGGFVVAFAVLGFLYIRCNQYILTSDQELFGLRYSPPGVAVQKQQPSLNSNFPLVWHDVL